VPADGKGFHSRRHSGWQTWLPILRDHARMGAVRRDKKGAAGYQFGAISMNDGETTFEQGA